MSTIDIETLLNDISPEAPSGEDLSFDSLYMELERAIQGDSGHVMGDVTIEAQEPNWNEVKTQALDVLSRSRDLRAMTFLTLAIMRRSGLPGLRDGLLLIQGALEKHWDTLHPQLDPDDDNDPMERMNILAAISLEGGFQDPVDFLRRLSEVPLVSVPQLGSFSLHDIQIAQGSVPAPEAMKNPPEMAHVEGAFSATDPETLAATALASGEALAALRRINEVLLEKVGAGQAPNLMGLETMLGRIDGLFQGRGAGAVDAPPAEEASLPASTTPVGGAAPAAPAATGEIHTRDDVMKMLDKICDYYRRYEPSSPLPLLLDRARKLVSMEFVEIIKDLTPDALAQVYQLGGIKPPEEEEVTY
jgi:type VI secretion system protein ImpA